MKPNSMTRVFVATSVAAAVLAACGGGGDDNSGPALVAGTDVPVSATVDYQAATDFIKSIVAAGGSETAEPLRVGDVTLATSETAEPDPSI
ncbi:hypothetical protein BH11PSE7_BH11PSE7_14150 [soil metagenome]